MTVQEYLLTCLMEECNEIAQRCSKALRFGMDEIQPGQHLNNEQRIMDEIVDLRGVVREMQARGVFLKLLEPKYVTDRTARKREKIKQFMEYSASLGIIHPAFIGEK